MRAWLLLLACFVVRPNIASAHPGGLNRSGCHNDRKHGGYHCHRSTYSPPPASRPRRAATPKPKPSPKAASSKKPASSKRVRASRSKPVVKPQIATTADGVIAKMRSLKNAMCECETMACARTVHAEMDAWAKAQREAPTVAMSESDQKMAEAIGFDMGTCLGELELAERPQTLDRSMISAGIAAVKERVVECGANSIAKGTVKLEVDVTSEGVPSNVEVIESVGTGLGGCVATAVRGATFAKTQLGGSFSYPFVF